MCSKHRFVCSMLLARGRIARFVRFHAPRFQVHKVRMPCDADMKKTMAPHSSCINQMSNNSAM